MNFFAQPMHNIKMPKKIGFMSFLISMCSVTFFKIPSQSSKTSLNSQTSFSAFCKSKGTDNYEFFPSFGDQKYRNILQTTIRDQKRF